MKEKLQLLYWLQQIDGELEELEELKGDLPVAVKVLEEKEALLQGEIDQKNNLVNNAKLTREKSDGDAVDFKAKLEKYKEQLYNVKNNREYDAITKEIDFATNGISEAENVFIEQENLITNFVKELEELNSQFTLLAFELKTKQEELLVILKENEDEFLRLQNEKIKITSRLDEDSLDRYNTIHSARRGKAIAAIRKDSCGGCNNRIPPQHLIDIQRNNKIYNCEHCGRIVVSTEVAETASKIMLS